MDYPCGKSGDCSFSFIVMTDWQTESHTHRHRWMPNSRDCHHRE